jgi:hypothetical protein
MNLIRRLQEKLSVPYANKDLLVEKQASFTVSQILHNEYGWMLTIDLGSEVLNGQYAYVARDSAATLKLTFKDLPGRDDLLEALAEEVPFVAQLKKVGKAYRLSDVE